MLKMLARFAALAVVMVAISAGALAQGEAETPADTTPAATDSVTVGIVPTSSFVDLGNTEIYTKSLAALTILLVLAVLLESAFSLLFNWRVFLAYFSLKGIKTIIMVVVAYIIVVTFKVDVVASLVSAYTGEAFQSHVLSQLITAMILAGGSAGVYNIMKALGYRTDDRAQELAQRPPQTHAWLAVKVNRRNAVGDILITIAEDNSVPAPAPIAGFVGSGRPRLSELLFPSPNRFPQNGGYTLKAGQGYRIAAVSKDAAGTAIRTPAAPDDFFVFAPGAIVDLTVTL